MFDLKVERNEAQAMLMQDIMDLSHYPAYSGDIALAYSVRHTLVKHVIAKHMRYIRSEFGKVKYLRQKRTRDWRYLNGYTLPTAAVPYVLLKVLAHDEHAGVQLNHIQILANSYK